MATQQHEYDCRVVWTGNRGQGTAAYPAYDRTWNIETPGKPVINCSNDPLLGGDPALPNPEDLLLASISACHMLWYLHLASKGGIVVHKYVDDPLGIGEAEPSGAGQFVKAVLRPEITVAPGTDTAAADAIHGRIHRYCFIARSMGFPIEHDARYVEGE